MLIFHILIKVSILMKIKSKIIDDFTPGKPLRIYDKDGNWKDYNNEKLVAIAYIGESFQIVDISDIKNPVLHKVIG